MLWLTLQQASQEGIIPSYVCCHKAKSKGHYKHPNQRSHLNPFGSMHLYIYLPLPLLLFTWSVGATLPHFCCCWHHLLHFTDSSCQSVLTFSSSVSFSMPSEEAGLWARQKISQTQLQLLRGREFCWLSQQVLCKQCSFSLPLMRCQHWQWLCSMLCSRQEGCWWKCARNTASCLQSLLRNQTFIPSCCEYVLGVLRHQSGAGFA